MTRLETTAAGLRPNLILEELIARHGLIAVLRALFSANLRHRRRRHDEAALSDHLRRDMGLPTLAPPPRRMR
ncbi:hypothetical protein TL5118_02290 [Thalassovita autumnalis]|jgi:hypothetical protein|uniref:Uncharacterized protein n=1 Tax=Thalassovita autumnalis TaxID=2072972 RepID=A0A0P1FXU8_9RHOB|nr:MULTISPECIES: hypothetical protein [Thalassovita]CUH67666.1 hypothetical protein TL5118_02290 [Thalassovita autumnalis]CUH73987.1 hypothetical protein TL5120_03805 [Thalassovita autumnalis]|tara:strand:- start:238 stop:453 length:216 start_codon:yes stop_codon:yes gene_type:complete